MCHASTLTRLPRSRAGMSYLVRCLSCRVRGAVGYPGGKRRHLHLGELHRRHLRHLGHFNAARNGLLRLREGGPGVMRLRLCTAVGTHAGMCCACPHRIGRGHAGRSAARVCTANYITSSMYQHLAKGSSAPRVASPGPQILPPFSKLQAPPRSTEPRRHNVRMLEG